jgi:hypothetical protein
LNHIPYCVRILGLLILNIGIFYQPAEYLAWKACFGLSCSHLPATPRSCHCSQVRINKLGCPLHYGHGYSCFPSPHSFHPEDSDIFHTYCKYTLKYMIHVFFLPVLTISIAELSHGLNKTFHSFKHCVNHYCWNQCLFFHFLFGTSHSVMNYLMTPNQTVRIR